MLTKLPPSKPPTTSWRRSDSPRQQGLLSIATHLPDHLETLTDRARRRVGTWLRRDKYSLERLLGVGSMGAVYAATHRNGMRVAIKVLHTELANDVSLRSRFLREGYIANRVQHPGLVRVLDDDVDDDGSTFLVMELLEGWTLTAEWEAAGNTMPLERVVAITDAVLDVLSAIHAQGIVHRDVKPDNVFLMTDSLKLLDLGIARLTESRMTVSGQMMGTPGFASPEQAGGRVREVDARSDVYSVGAMMLTLLTGHVVHDAQAGMEAMVFAATRQARSLLEVWPKAPAALANVVDVALWFDKDKRWSSAAEMRTALGNAMRIQRTKTAPVPAPRPPSGPTGTVIGAKMEIVRGPYTSPNMRPDMRPDVSSNTSPDTTRDVPEPLVPPPRKDHR
jgi:serine/threonine protein kinase